MKYHEAISLLFGQDFNPNNFLGSEFKYRAITCDDWDNHVTKRCIVVGGGMSNYPFMSSWYIDPVFQIKSRAWGVFHPTGCEIVYGDWKVLTEEQLEERGEGRKGMGCGPEDMAFQEFIFNWGRKYDCDYTFSGFKKTFMKFTGHMDENEIEKYKQEHGIDINARIKELLSDKCYCNDCVSIDIPKRKHN